jgi:hypothetical protein
MAIILFNPTNEELKDQYIGEDVVLPPGSKTRVDDARGRHMLNTMGPRGLVTLEYGDEGEGEARKAAAGRARNLKFKRDHVDRFNSQNDRKFQRKQTMDIPDVKVKEYARELGIKLFEPYTSTDDSMAPVAAMTAELDAKTRELAEKDTALETLQAQVATLTTMMAKFMGVKAAAGDQVGADHWVEFQKKYRNINGKYFHNWVADQWSEIVAAPAEIKQELADKYERLYSMPFPANDLEAKALAQAAS